MYTQGRGGKGSIYVWAAGNGGHLGDSCAADGFVSSIYTIAIGSASANGTAAFYDEKCSAKMATNFITSDSDLSVVRTYEHHTQTHTYTHIHMQIDHCGCKHSMYKFV